MCKMYLCIFNSFNIFLTWKKCIEDKDHRYALSFFPDVRSSGEECGFLPDGSGGARAIATIGRLWIIAAASRGLLSSGLLIAKRLPKTTSCRYWYNRLLVWWGNKHLFLMGVLEHDWAIEDFWRFCTSTLVLQKRSERNPIGCQHAYTTIIFLYQKKPHKTFQDFQVSQPFFRL